jgi:hypothetical protein
MNNRILVVLQTLFFQCRYNRDQHLRNNMRFDVAWIGIAIFQQLMEK